MKTAEEWKDFMMTTEGVASIQTANSFIEAIQLDALQQGRIEGIMMAAEIPDSMRGEGESDLRCVRDRIKALAKNLPIDNSKG